MTRAEGRTYSRVECVSFRKTDAEFGGLSNMAPGFPLEVNGIAIRTSEALYQACRFPHLPKVQHLIIDETSPMTAKMKSKPYRKDSRPDWDAIRVKVMRWCLRVKLAQNWEKFGALLLDTGDRPIVEDSRKDDFWGAKALEGGKLAGANVLGRLLMELREQLRGPDPDSLLRVEPPPVPDFLLYSEPISAVEGRTAGVRAVDSPLTSHGGTGSGQRTLRAASVSSAIDAATAGSNTGTPTSTRLPEAPEAHTTSAAGQFPKRLIEIDLPIRRISAHARREKAIHHGHISTLHIWWARRPLAACRAMILAALWPDPADGNCPDQFRREARDRMRLWARDFAKRSSAESFERLTRIQRDPAVLDDATELRKCLLDFIADFANWDNSNDPAYLETSRALVQVAHSALGGDPGTRPLIVDPFAGGGAIPLEALRVGANAFASDLNPVAVLLNKVLLEYIPKYGQGLSDQIRKWGEWIRQKAGKELGNYYPKDPDGATPIVYLWARTIRCEGPSCGFVVPLIRNLQFTQKAGGWHYELRVNAALKRFDVAVQRGSVPASAATVAGGAVTCPKCHFTTPPKAVRAQLVAQRGGARTAQLLATGVETNTGRHFRPVTDRDVQAAERADGAVDETQLPRELINPTRPYKNTRGLSAVTRIGLNTFADLHNGRQARALQVLWSAVQTVDAPSWDAGLRTAVRSCLACAAARLVFQNCTLSRWHATRDTIEGAFGKQALQNTWDFAEANPISDGPAAWPGAVEWVVKVIEANSVLGRPASVMRARAQSQTLPDDSADAIVTDPPYFASIPYADLSDVFYVWEREFIRVHHPDLFTGQLTEKEPEIIVTDANPTADGGKKTAQFYEEGMAKAFEAARHVLRPNGVAVVVFADSRTESWEAILGALLSAGWSITGSWPIDTELQNRTQAAGSASLQSSVHVVCRPRERPDGSLSTDTIGDWRDVLAELPKRIHDWMPRLAEEGVVGADAIFACLGPALEVFSRYSRVEKASGEPVLLREYLEHVWAAVAKEALSMIFAGAETAGFEEDARLTAMWLWTLSAGGANGKADAGIDKEEPEEDEDVGKTAKKTRLAGFALEYDAARKIAQGLGVHLEELGSLVNVKGDTARLLPVAERTRALFGIAEADSPTPRRKKRAQQMKLGFAEELEEAEETGGWGQKGAPKLGDTVLDRVHQSMILFAAGRGEALRRFLVDEGAGRDARFWRLAHALAALYPTGTDERRWVDGVLARKKGLGF